MSDTNRHSPSRVAGADHGAMVLRAQGLRQSYGDTVALDGVDLDVAAGTIVGLVGPNGAGKTSLVSIVAGLRRPDAGCVLVGGVDVVRSPSHARRLIGMAPQETGVYGLLRVRDNLRFFAGLAGVRRAELGSRVEAVAIALGLDGLLERRAASDHTPEPCVRSMWYGPASSPSFST
jgi:ABC-2 type transport system ATP-binding protein